MSEIEIKIINEINKIRPYLQKDGGDCEYVRFEDGIVYIRMVGACAGCGSLDVTLKDFIEATLLEKVPKVIGVENLVDE